MPVVIDLGAIFIALCAFAVCWCLLQAYSSTLGALLGHLADVAKSVTVPHTSFHPFKWLGDGLEHINHFIQLQLGNAVEGTAYAWHKLVGQLASFVSETGRLIGDLTTASAQAWSYAYRHGIRQVVLFYTSPLTAAIHALQALVRDLHHTTNTVTHKVTQVVTHELPRITVKVIEAPKVAAQTAVKAVAVTGAGTLPRIKTLEREVSGLEKWVKQHRRTLTEAGVVGLVAAAVSRLGINWTRCSNTKRWGKHVCGMDPQLLESLLADSLLILGTVSLVEFAEGMQTVVGDAETQIRRFWRAT